MTPVLEAKGIVKRFGGLTAVNHVSLAVGEQEIVGLIGPNGAGKTTFLNSIAGTFKPTGGAVNFLGTDFTGHSANAMCRAGMSRTFQISQPFPRLTALENVMVAAVFGNVHGAVKDPTAWSLQMLDFVEFPMPPETPAHALNTVQLKRLDLARALASKPKLLLLDELAAGLATGELDDLMAIIRKIRDSGVSILIVEHIMKVIMGLCERIVVIQYGTKIAEGSPEEVAHDPQVTEAYLGKEYIL